MIVLLPLGLVVAVLVALFAPRQPGERRAGLVVGLAVLAVVVTACCVAVAIARAIGGRH